MIKLIKVDGFRTLTNFKLELNPGLNVLVGPNGSGKTTLILFFAFLNDLFSSNLSTAISNVGGAGAIFRKEGLQEFQRTITAEVTGVYDLSDARSDDGAKATFGKYLYYKYCFHVELSKDREEVFYCYQNLLVRRSVEMMKWPDRIKKWHIQFERRLHEGQNQSNFKSLIKDFGDRFEIPDYRREDLKVNNVVNEYVGNDDCLVHAIRLLGSDLRIPLTQDFSRGILYNPQPDQIRNAEDSAKQPGIRSDGSGLYSSLLALKNKRPIRVRRPLVPLSTSEIPFIRPNNLTLARVVDYFRLAFPSLYQIDVINDPFDNQIRARVILDGVDGTQLPLSALSDGTLKWMALVTALLTTRHIIGIEEPENFLHPAAQQQALELIREHAKRNSFVLVSSHSESILNATNPAELIIVVQEDGRTIARRVKDPDRIRKLIFDSGFGLSFFYLSGVLHA